jgi:glucan biosynthesis protein C
MSNQERYHGLDFVRAVAMMLGLSVHVNIFYFSEDRMFWSAGEYHGDPINQSIAFFIFQFRMPLFYMLAGFFALLVIERKGLSFMTGDRVKRIGIPFVVGIALLKPIIEVFWCVNTTYENTLFELSAWERFKHIIFWGTFSDKEIPFNLPLGHLWFIYFLLFYYAAHFLFRYVRLKLLGSVHINIDSAFKFFVTNKLGLFLLPLLFFPLRYSLKQPGIGLNQVDFEWNSFLLYGSHYLFGVLLYRNRECLKTIAKHCWYYAIIAVPVFVYVIEPASRVESSPSVVWDITSWHVSGVSLWNEGIFHTGWFKVVICYLKDLSCFTLCFAFIGLAHRFLNKPSPYVRYLADSAYWAFWIHLLPTFVLSSYLQQFDSVNSLAKSYVAFVVSAFLVYWTYNAFVRYSFLGDYFMGRRKNRTDEGEEQFSTTNLVKLTIKPVLYVGVGVFIFGSMLHQHSLTQKGHLIVESYVARNQALLDETKSFDHVYDTMGNTPLHAAVKMNEKWRRYDPVPILIAKTSDLNTPNVNGRTPLFEAVRGGNIGDIKKLIQAGADLNKPDKYGHTPAHVAAIKTGLLNKAMSDHFFDLLKLLQENGADLSLKDYRNRSVEDCLRYFGNRMLK